MTRTTPRKAPALTGKKRRERRARIWNRIGMGVVAAVTLALLIAFLNGSIQSPRRSRGNGSAAAPRAAGTPWEYDATANRHYDPRPGHEHWHDGPPPAESERSGSGPSDTLPGSTPAPLPQP